MKLRRRNQDPEGQKFSGLNAENIAKWVTKRGGQAKYHLGDLFVFETDRGWIEISHGQWIIEEYGRWSVLDPIEFRKRFDVV